MKQSFGMTLETGLFPERGDGFYGLTHDPLSCDDASFSLCQESIQAAFGRTPERIIVTFSDVRPHRRGWVQIRLKDGKFVIKKQKFAKLACQINRWPINAECVWVKLW